MRVTYGITIALTEDRYIRLAEKALEGMSTAARPGAFLVDFVPFCKRTFLVSNGYHGLTSGNYSELNRNSETRPVSFLLSSLL